MKQVESFSYTEHFHPRSRPNTEGLLLEKIGMHSNVDFIIDTRHACFMGVSISEIGATMMDGQRYTPKRISHLTEEGLLIWLKEEHIEDYIRSRWGFGIFDLSESDLTALKIPMGTMVHLKPHISGRRFLWNDSRKLFLLFQSITFPGSSGKIDPEEKLIGSKRRKSEFAEFAN